MLITNIMLKNITVFNQLNLDFSPGLNVFLGENGTGKTHILKMLYAACKSGRKDIPFSHKLNKVFKPDGSELSRLISRKPKLDAAEILVKSEQAAIALEFKKNNSKWDLRPKDEEKWEKVTGGTNCTFIPAKEILSNGWHFEAAVNMGNVEFDDTYVDVVSAAKIKMGNDVDGKAQKKYFDILQQAKIGQVELDKDRFYLQKKKSTSNNSRNNSRIEFSLVAEGIRKLALIWQLINNGALEKNSILFWDEPEANLNPKYIPIVAMLLLELQRNGVQVFVSTHDYFLSKYFEIKRNDEDKILYHSLYFENDMVMCESRKSLSLLEHNMIHDTFIKLYEDEIEKAME